MTDTIDPSSDTLPGRRSALVVTTDDPIREVRIAYEEEVVYRTVDGVGTFVAPYLGSELSVDKRALTVERTGSWPKPFDIHVEEAPPAATPTGWDVLLDQDFTSFPNGTLQTSGALADYTETLGGVVWRFTWRGNGTGSVVSQGQINGQGYRLSSRASSGPADAFPGAYMCTDHTQLAGYVAGRRSCVLAVVDGAQNAGVSTRALVGHFKPIIGASQGFSTIVNNSAICGGYYPRLSDSTIAGILCAQNARDKPVESQGPASSMYMAARPLDTTQTVFGAIRVSDSEGEAIYGPYDGTTPVVEHLRSAGSVDTVSYSGGGLQAGVLWSTDFTTSFGEHCLVKRILILQAKS